MVSGGACAHRRGHGVPRRDGASLVNRGRPEVREKEGALPSPHMPSTSKKWLGRAVGSVTPLEAATFGAGRTRPGGSSGPCRPREDLAGGDGPTLLGTAPRLQVCTANLRGG